MKKRILTGNLIGVTAALPYLNNSPHLGHLYSTQLQADLITRYLRAKLENVVFISGSDVHGLPIIRESYLSKQSVKKLFTNYHKLHRKVYKKFYISHDLYSSTFSVSHKKLVRRILLQLDKLNMLEKVSSSIEFCTQCRVTCNIEDNRIKESICKICEQTDTVISRPNAELALKLNTNDKSLKEYSLKEITRYVAGHGVKVPLKLLKKYNLEQSKRIYVWFEALIGYLSILSQRINMDIKKCKDIKLIQFFGKDNLFFHTTLWPVILSKCTKIQNYTLKCSNFLTLNGKKFSKSEKYGIFCDTLLNETKSNIDAIRFLLISIYHDKGDGELSEFVLKSMLVGVLVNKISNLFNRFTKLFTSIYTIEYNKLKYEQFVKNFANSLSSFVLDMELHLRNLEIFEFFNNLVKFVDMANTILNNFEPWKKTEGYIEFLYAFKGVLYTLGLFLYFIMPYSIGTHIFKRNKINIQSLYTKSCFSIEYISELTQSHNLQVETLFLSSDINILISKLIDLSQQNIAKI